MKLTESRTIVELLEQRKMLDCDYPFAQYGESGEFDVIAGQTNDCVDVTLAAGDVLSVRFSIGKTTVDPNPNDPANTIVELKDIGGNKVIGSRHAFIGTTPCCFGFELPPDSPALRDGRAAFVYHAHTAGIYTVSVNHTLLSINGEYSLKVSRLRPHEELPYGSRQYVYLDFNGANVNLTNAGGTSSESFSSIDAFLNRYGRGKVTSADTNIFIDKVVGYMETQFPEFKGRVLNSRDHASSELAYNVSRVIIGDASSWHGQSAAEWVDQGNFVYNDIAAIDTNSSDMNTLTSVVLCTSIAVHDLPCKSGFEGESYASDKDVLLGLLSQFIGRIAAHEVGHNLGHGHVLAPFSFDDMRAVMKGGAIVTATEGLQFDSVNNVDHIFVGKTIELDLAFGTSDSLLINPSPGVHLASDFYGLWLNEQADRIGRAMNVVGEGRGGLWYSYRKARLNDLSIQPGELVYAADGPDTMIKVEEISPGEVSISECTSGFSQCALVGVQEEVTKVRLISDGGIQNQFNSDFPVTVEGVWKNASSRPVDVDGVAVLINETVFGGTRDSEEVSIEADGTGIKVTLNGQVLGTVANSSRFRFIGRGGADIFRNGAVDAITKSADFNLDTFIDARDIDELYAALDGSYNSFFDLNEDGFLDQEDVDFIVKVLFDSIYGDSNLDGHFNSTDLVHVFVIGEYQDGIAVNSGWADGDWSGDQDFDSSDFVFSLTNSEYEG